VNVPKVAVVVVSYNAAAHLARCLAALGTPSPTVSHEIVVVDNASEENVREVVARFAAVRLIVNTVNVGYARANNQGIRATGSELVLLLNPDAVLRGADLDRLVTALDSDPQAAVLGPRLVDELGVPELSFGRMISPFNELRQKALVRLSSAGVRRVRQWIERQTGRRRAVDWVSGACLLVRRADAEAVGLLDERFFIYGEDVDFCAAIRQRGHKVVFDPVVTVVHTGGGSGQTAPSATTAHYRRSHLAFYQKHHPAWAPLLRSYLRVRGQLPTD